jgi:transcriptional regulator with XRE-family HTH domain
MALRDQLRKAARDAIKHGETRYSLAKRAGVDQTAFRDWLNDDSDIRISTASKIAEALGLELTPGDASKVKR